MAKDKESIKCDCHGWKHRGHAKSGGAYFLGFLGAIIYYLQNAAGFWPGVLAILKAIVWPVFLVHHLLGL